MKICGLDLSISSSGIVIEDIDENFNIKSIEYFGFTQKKKLSSDNILLYNNKEFNNNYEKYIWMTNSILEWCKDCEYIAIEDYAYGKGSSNGMVFNLAEFEGHIKISLANNGKKLRFYAVNQIKKFFSEYGLSDKIGMRDAFNRYTGTKPDISDLPEVDNGHGVSPTSDIIDAFAICEFLRKELRLRHLVDDISNEPKYIKECFMNDTKANPLGILAAPWIEVN